MWRRIVITFLIAIPALAWGAAGVMSRDAKLRAEPNTSAASRGSLAAQAPVEMLERKGGWYRIKTVQGQALDGWVRLADVRVERNESAGGAGVQGYLGSGRAGARDSVATTGIRGLSETDIANAQPDFAALSQLARYSTTPADVSAHAARLGLRSQTVALFPQDRP